MATHIITGGTESSPLTFSNAATQWQGGGLKVGYNTWYFDWQNHNDLTDTNQYKTIQIGDGSTPTFVDWSSWTIVLRQNVIISVKNNVTFTAGKMQGDIPVNGMVVKMESGSRFICQYNGTLQKIFLYAPRFYLYGWSHQIYMTDFNEVSELYDVQILGDLPNNIVTTPLVTYQNYGIAHADIKMINCKLRCDRSTTTFNSLYMSGSHFTKPDLTDITGNTRELTVDRYSPHNSTQVRISSIYWKTSPTYDKTFTFNNAFLIPENIETDTCRMSINFNVDCTITVDQPDVAIVTIDTLDEIPVIQSSGTFTLSNVYQVYSPETKTDGTFEGIGGAGGIVGYDRRNVELFITKYGYVPNVATEFVDIDGEFSAVKFMTPYLDTHLTEAEALAVLASITIISNPDYAENEKFWDWTIDCGGNDARDVADAIYALRCSTDTYFGRIGVKWWGMLVKDGAESAKTIAYDNGDGTYQGVRVINYGGNITTTQSNDGTNFTPIQYANLTLTNLKANSRVKVFEISPVLGEGNVPVVDENGDVVTYLYEVGGTEASGVSYTYAYNWSGDVDVEIAIFHNDYLPITLNTTLTSANTSIPVNQIIDKVFNNLPAPILATPLFGTGKNIAITFTKAQLLEGTTYDDQVFNNDHLTAITVLEGPSNGTFVDNGDDTYTYTPNTDYLGSDFIRYAPTYSETYLGVITNGLINFDVHVFEGDKYENLIILGDSINVRNFKSGAVLDSFMARHLELYGFNLSTFNEAVSGKTTRDTSENVNTYLDKHIDLEAEGGIVWVSVGTNDFYTVRDARILDPYYNYDSDIQTKIWNYLDPLRSSVVSRGYEFSIGQQAFLRYSEKDENTIYDPLNNVFVDNLTTGTPNEIVMGSWLYNDHPTYGFDKGAETYTAKYTLADGTPMDQLYAYTRMTRHRGFEDAVHPNEYGAYITQQALLDSICLYNAYGMKPIKIDPFVGPMEAWTVLHDAVISNPDRYGRIPVIKDMALASTYSYTADWMDGTASTYTVTITIDGTYSVINSNIAADNDHWVDSDWMGKAVVLESGSSMTITIGGLVEGKAYKFQALGYVNEPTGVYNTDYHNPTLNKTITRYPMRGKWKFADFTLLPQGTTDSIVITPNSSKAAISVFNIQLLSEGVL